MWANHFCSQNMMPFFSERNQTFPKMYEISRNVQIHHKPFRVHSALNLYKIVQTRLVQDSQNVLFKSESVEDCPKMIKCMENIGSGIGVPSLSRN